MHRYVALTWIILFRNQKKKTHLEILLNKSMVLREQKSSDRNLTSSGRPNLVRRKRRRRRTASPEIRSGFFFHGSKPGQRASSDGATSEECNCSSSSSTRRTVIEWVTMTHTHFRSPCSTSALWNRLRKVDGSVWKSAAFNKHKGMQRTDRSHVPKTERKSRFGSFSSRYVGGKQLGD